MTASARTFRKLRLGILVAIAALATSLVACTQTASVTDPTPGSAAVDLDPDRAAPGATVRATITGLDAAEATLAVGSVAPGIEARATSHLDFTVPDLADGTYNVVVAEGSRSASARLTIARAPSDPGPGAEAPQISSFAATPSSITPGESSILAWTLGGGAATAVEITPDIGRVSGSEIAVRPAETTTYTLTASNAAGEDTRTTTVSVGSGGADLSGDALGYTGPDARLFAVGLVTSVGTPVALGEGSIDATGGFTVDLIEGSEIEPFLLPSSFASAYGIFPGIDVTNPDARTQQVSLLSVYDPALESEPNDPDAIIGSLVRYFRPGEGDQTIELYTDRAHSVVGEYSAGGMTIELDLVLQEAGWYTVSFLSTETGTLITSDPSRAAPWAYIPVLPGP